MTTATRPVTGPDGDNPITDEQIGSLRGLSVKSRDWDIVSLCESALRRRDPWLVERCAAAWNARQGGAR